ncbi:MAG: hypothetical protein HC880_21550, partial [Bacteroidia bacterium]|nr:hypothetical protein [Bacteroidia bacterium]
MRILKITLLSLVLLTLVSGCRTIRELTAFTRCDFRVADIARLNLGNVNLLNINNLDDVNLADAAKLALAFKNGSLPLDLTFNIEARNPNDQTAALEKLDWILEVDNNDMVSGTSNDRIEVAPNGGTTTFPISTGLDIRKVLEKESLKSIVNLVAGIKGNNMDDSRIRLKNSPPDSELPALYWLIL